MQLSLIAYPCCLNDDAGFMRGMCGSMCVCVCALGSRWLCGKVLTDLSIIAAYCSVSLLCTLCSLFFHVFKMTALCIHYLLKPRLATDSDLQKNAYPVCHVIITNINKIYWDCIIQNKIFVKWMKNNTLSSA